jgi:tRNA nucleotidyltransferase/poly(A) polymerase
MKRILLPGNVKLIIDKLNKAGFEAFAVGGCVRDSLLGKEPNDWDITTNADTTSIMSVFSGFHVVPCGIKYGSVTVIIDSKSYEVTSYRIDGSYSDNRRPDEVYFTQSLMEDLKRRDFTINAMAYGPESGLVDLYGGEQDLRKNVIRCVGNPQDRFREDALRMMRAVRFAAQLGFNIETGTLDAIRNNAELLRSISVERITSEFNKILTSDHTEKIGILVDTRLMDYIVPEFAKCAGVMLKDVCHAEGNTNYVDNVVNRIENDIARDTIETDNKMKNETNIENNTVENNAIGHIIKSIKYIENKLNLRLALFFRHIAYVRIPYDVHLNISHDTHANISHVADIQMPNDVYCNICDNVYEHTSGDSCFRLPYDINKNISLRNCSRVSSQLMAKISSNLTGNIMKRMKYDNKTINEVKTLVLYSGMELTEDEVFIRWLMSKIGEEGLRKLIKVKEADIMAQNMNLCVSFQKPALCASSQSPKQYESSQSSKQYESSQSSKQYESSQSSKQYEGSLSPKQYESSHNPNRYESSYHSEQCESSRLLKQLERSRHYASSQYYEKWHDKMVKISAIADEIIAKGHCFSLDKLAVNGNDLEGVGIRQGPVLGKILGKLLDLVIVEPQINEKGILLEHAVRFYRQIPAN